VSFATITLCVASQRVFIFTFCYRLSPETFGYTRVRSGVDNNPDKICTETVKPRREAWLYLERRLEEADICVLMKSEVQTLD
jgi:hypothetical protein